MNQRMTENDLNMLIKQLDLESLEVEPTNEERLINYNPDSLKQHGWIQVKDQTITVRNSTENGSSPTLLANEPLKLYINDSEVRTETAVSSKDRIRWEIVEKPLFDIHVSEDKLYAYFQLCSKERYAWRLIDTEPSLKVALTAEEDKDIVLETVHFHHVFAMLEQQFIKSNLGVAVIQQELVDPTYKPVVIAKGKAAVPGRDAQLEIYFPEQVENHFFDVGGSIDFRNHLQIPSVNKGEMIAKKIPMAYGVPGYDVYGGVIVPPLPKDIMVVAKSNVELTPDGEVIALKDGRPRLTGGKIKTFDISTAYVVSGDVDIETGNIVFSGDVIVYGNVTDTMIIESLGNVYVYGSVYNATITATGSIHVRGNVIGSKLYSGYFGVMFNRLYQTAKWLVDKIEQLHSAAQMLAKVLEQRKQSIRWGQMILLLMESKFNDIPVKIKELLSVISNIQHLKKEEYQKLKERSTVFLHPHLLLETATSTIVQGFISMLRETHQEVERMQEEDVKTVFSRSHNSELKSNGDIVILRDGVILSDLYSAGNIVFKNNDAVCRGSKLEAGGSIAAKIVGGRMGANTILKAKRQVTAKIIFSGRVCVGNYCTDILEVIENKTFTVHSMRNRA